MTHSKFFDVLFLGLIFLVCFSLLFPSAFQMNVKVDVSGSSDSSSDPVIPEDYIKLPSYSSFMANAGFNCMYFCNSELCISPDMIPASFSDLYSYFEYGFGAASTFYLVDLSLLSFDQFKIPLFIEDGHVYGLIQYGSVCSDLLCIGVDFCA